MELSARNQFTGRVTRIVRGGVVAEVTVDIGHGQEIVSVITNSSVDRLQLAEGSPVTAIVKATEVLLASG
jgi:molybdate transport system regulatory protein